MTNIDHSFRPPDSFVELSRTLGDPAEDMVILAEGNTSARAGEDRFWVKASGRSLREISAAGFVLVRFEPLLAALDRTLTDEEVREVLREANDDPASGKVPSVEAFMHAWLLRLPGVHVVGHTHPTALLPLLCLEESETLANSRLFPDEIVCCGQYACWVPYVDPGIELAKAITRSVTAFQEQHGQLPKVLWLQNHGLIALGATPAEVISASRMSVKAARVWQGLLAMGRPIHILPDGLRERIENRPDEHFRQKMLWGDPA